MGRIPKAEGVFVWGKATAHLGERENGQSVTKERSAAQKADFSAFFGEDRGMSFRLLPLGLVLILAACGEQIPTSPRFPVPNQLTLYSIREDRDSNNEGAAQAEKLEDFPLLGQVDIPKLQTRQEIMAAVNKGVADSKGSAACFNPRHGLRAITGQQQTDYIICFECSLMYVLTDGKRTAYAISSFPQQTLNKIFVDAGIPLNKAR